MRTIKINNVIFPVLSYSHYINYIPSFLNDGSCTVIANDLTTIEALAQNTITLIQIYIDEELIYNFETEAQITGIQHSLENDQMVVNIMFSFQTLDN